MMNYLYLCLCVMLCAPSQAQEVLLVLNNASFEGYPHDAITPNGWESCGYDSTPDILPGPWGVYQKPTDGNTFIGLISREDNTWEMIMQELVKPLDSEKCYKFSVSLSRSPTYAGYNKPLRLRIWGGNTPCERKELLINSPTIDHYEWSEYTFMFSPIENYKYILIECYYKKATLVPYRGNLLIDGITPFVECDRA